jgi:hypothetical protein
MFVFHYYAKPDASQMLNFLKHGEKKQLGNFGMNFRHIENAKIRSSKMCFFFKFVNLVDKTMYGQVKKTRNNIVT